MSVRETEGQVALVTGATSGIGRSSAIALARVGFDVAAVGRRTDRLESLAADLGELGRACLQLPMDLTDVDGPDRVVGRVGERWGRLDAVVAAAGHGRGYGSLVSADPAHWAPALQLNLLSVMTLASLAVPMLMGSRGTLVLIGSVFAVDPAPEYAAYAAAKHGLRAFSRSIRRERDLRGVRVCLINPGTTNTEFASVISGADEPFTHDPVVWPFTPLSADDVATAVCWVVQQPAHVTIEELTLRGTDDR